jgi:hypothetical protein
VAGDITKFNDHQLLYYHELLYHHALLQDGDGLNLNFQNKTNQHNPQDDSLMGCFHAM